ncbi:MAG: type IV secretory system conjugative DNA transfer family protein, partial [Sedimenticola sp.]
GDDGTEHVLISAPSRSGKGVGIVIPNLLNWDHSVVVLDIKMENFKATSGFREKHGHKVFLFNPADISGVTHCYNPLMVIPNDPHFRVNEIQKVSNFLAPTPQQGDPMWSSEARKLFLAAVLFLQDTGKPITLGEVYRLINGNNAEDLEKMIEEHSKDLDPACISNFINYISMGGKQRSGVKSTLTSALDLFDNPLIDAATSKCDFSFSDLRKEKISIYVGVTPNNLARLKPLLNLFFQQCIDQNTQSLPDKSTEPYKILMLMDEFISLGRMEIIKDGIAFFAGYHIRLMPIIQGPSQLADKYGDDGKRSMISNFKFRVVFAPNDPKDAEEISRELGTKTVNQKSRSKGTWSAQNGSITTSKTGRALLLPQEIKQLKDKKEIIIVEAMPPIMADKIVYYTDKWFKNRFFNIYDPEKNTGPVPSKVPILDLVSAMEARRGSITLDSDTLAGNETHTIQPDEEHEDKMTLTETEMDSLLTEFWNTGTST